MPSDDHLHPQPPPQVAEAVLRALPAGCEAVLVARGQYNPGDSQRILVLARAGRRARAVADTWMARDDEQRLVERLAPHLETRAGECDAMYATPWGCAWTTDDRPFELWDGHGRLLWLDGPDAAPVGAAAAAFGVEAERVAGEAERVAGEAERVAGEAERVAGEAERVGRRATPRMRRGRGVVDLPPPRAVHGHLSDDWIRRQVRLLYDDRRPLHLAGRVELGALLDPTYDGLDLLCDAFWVYALATRLGAALGVPVELDPDLR